MQDYDGVIANQLMDDLKNLILEFEAEHHLDLIVKFEPERWCYTSDMSYMDVSELLREFFLSHYSGYSWCRNDVLSIDVFEEIAEECEDKSIVEFRDKIIEATKKLLDDNITPIVDKHWPKIEEAMANVQKYFPGLKITKDYNEYDGYDVSIIYFTKDGKLFSDDFNPDDLFHVYYTVDDLCDRISCSDGVDGPAWIRYQDDWFEDMHRYVPEDQIDKINFSNYVLIAYSEECNFKAITNIFKYFDKNNDIKIKVW